MRRNSHQVRLFLLIVALFAVCAMVQRQEIVSAQPGKVGERSGITDSMDDLTQQLLNCELGEAKPRITVIDFSDLDGNECERGKFVAEELLMSLFKTGRFEVIERRLLTKLLQQHELNMSGLVDEDSACKSGKLLGVDYIVTGTVAEAANWLNINARLISIQTGSILAMGSAKLGKEEAGPVLAKVKDSSTIKRDVHEGDDFSPVRGKFTPWMDEMDYQKEFDQKFRYGYYSAVVEGRSFDKRNQYRAIFEPFIPGVFYFYSYHGQLKSSYDQNNGDLLSRGFECVHLQIFEDYDGMRRYQATWIRRHH